MVKAWDWQEATANTKDQDGDEHESKVTYAVVSDEQNGYEVNTISGVVKVQPGDVLVQNPGDNQGRVDVLPKDVWANNDYSTGSNTQNSSNSSKVDSSSTGRR
jgi:hypothetical protein